MGLCNCFETTPATYKHYQKLSAICWDKNESGGRDVSTCVSVGLKAKQITQTKKIKEIMVLKEKEEKAIISHRHSVHTFHISQFLCCRFVNSSIAHRASANILDLIELSGANVLPNTINTFYNQTGMNMTQRDAVCCVRVVYFECNNSVSVRGMAVTGRC